MLGADGLPLVLAPGGGAHSEELRIAQNRIAGLLAPGVLALLERELALSPRALQVFTPMLDLGLQDSDGKWGMHSDFHSMPHYVFTALVYLSDYGADFTGGETVFLHGLNLGEPLVIARDATGRGDIGRRAYPLRTGVVVQPRRGRVVIFTGGAENLHSKVPSVRVGGASAADLAAPGGAVAPRRVFQFWVNCKSPFEKWRPEGLGGLAAIAAEARAHAQAMRRARIVASELQISSL
jgi:hypothetical protein